MIGFLQRLLRGTRKVKCRHDWMNLLGPDWTNTIMEVAVTDDFHAKQGRSTGRWVIEKDGKRLVVYLKRHYRLPWWRGLLAQVCPKISWSPGLQEWHHLQWASSQGFPVPGTVASVEYLGPGCRLQSMLAIEELTDMLPLHQAIPYAKQVLLPQQFVNWKRYLIAELARLSRELHQRDHFHKDLYLCHFYLPRSVIYNWQHGGQKELQGQLHIIDFHRLGHHPLTHLWWQIKDLAQLLYSTDVEGVTPQDRVRFWRLYRRKTRRTWKTKFLEWCIRVKWWRYRDHNNKRQRRNARLDLKRKEAAA